MRPELRKEILRILDDLSSGASGHVSLTFRTSPLTIEAVQQLSDRGALSKLGGSKAYRITGEGYDYYQQLKARPTYRLKKTVAPTATKILVTIGVGVIIGLIVEFLR